MTRLQFGSEYTTIVLISLFTINFPIRMERRNNVGVDGDDQSEDGQLQSPYDGNDRYVLISSILIDVNYLVEIIFIHFIFNIA